MRKTGKKELFRIKSIRILNQEWRQMSMAVTKTHKPISIPINALLNCGKDVDSLTGIEKNFFIDHTGATVGRISDSIDVDYVNEKKAELAAATAAAERDTMEKRYALKEVADEYFNMNSRDAQLDVSLNRSGHVRSTATTTDFGVQHDSTGARPKIWKTRNCTNKIKSTCAEVSVKCNISNQGSLVAVQTVYNSFYGHEYYLTKEEAIVKDPSLEELRSESTAQKNSKDVQVKRKVNGCSFYPKMESV